ncbi:MAG: hypothetical protein IKQ15_01870 [Kiritimatiellae bacterium]|nr:hypothetical protein [Kiritimatiellia bacterium]
MSWGIRWLAMGLAAAAVCLAEPARGAGGLVPAKADIRSVELDRRPMQTVTHFGAGIRPPHLAVPDGGESEHFVVQWFAHSPGIPPGALVMLETVTDRQPTVQTRIRRMPSKSEGDMTSRFDIPPEDTLRAGPVSQWRVRIVWRGRPLATRTSAGWAAAGKGIP